MTENSRSLESSTDLGRHYAENLSRYERLAAEVKFILEAATADVGLRTHSIAVRVKTQASFLEKIARKGYLDPIAEVDDLVGARLVCLFTPDLQVVRQMVEENFTILSEEDKTETASPDSFGYMSTHFVCVLRNSDSGRRYQGLRGIRFEIQARTILMDAWASVSHHLAYKTDQTIPVELRRDFHALAGLFYVADKHFELFFRSSRSLSQDIQAGPAPDSLESGTASNDQAARYNVINRDTVAALLQRLYPERTEEVDEDFLGNAAEFADELLTANYVSIREVEQDLLRANSALGPYEKKFPPGAEAGALFQAVGLARNALAIANETYRYQKYKGIDRFREFEPYLMDSSAREV